jgi:hypothetical protein
MRNWRLSKLVRRILCRRKPFLPAGSTEKYPQHIHDLRRLEASHAFIEKGNQWSASHTRKPSVYNIGWVLSHVILFTQVMPEAVFVLFSFDGSFRGRYA